MEPANKKAKITGHFRVALKPQNINAQANVLKQKLTNQLCNHTQNNTLIKDEKQQLATVSSQNKYNKENKIEIITISDDEDGDDHVENGKAATRMKDSLKHKHDNNKQVTLATNVASKINSNLITKPKLAINTYLNNIINNNNNKTQLENKHNTNILTDDKSTNVKHQNATKQPQTIQVNLHKPQQQHINKYMPPPGLNDLPVPDHDLALLHDIRCEPHYAWDIFQYDREQELKYKSKLYMDDKTLNHSITPEIRAELVDWLVLIQNHFALDHEVLYMAVKLADHYLMKKSLNRKRLPLLYITSVLISGKFDERLPPFSISELLHQIEIKYDLKYSRKQVISFEVEMLATLEFNIRYPLSYGFLRRYAQCTRSDRRTLTLARFILESSLLDYELIDELDSKVAAASLLLACKMLQLDDTWNATAEFYTGYKQEDLLCLLTRLNATIIIQRDRHVIDKYNDEVFMSVARISPLPQGSALNA